MTGLEVVVHGSVREIPEWDAIRPPNGVYLAGWWMEHAEALLDVSRTYITVVRDGRTLGAASCWTIPRKGILLPPLEATRLFSRWKVDGNDVTRQPAEVPDAELYPFTILGSPRGYMGKQLVAEDLDAETRRAVIAKLALAGEEVARRDGAKLLLLPYLAAGDTTDTLAATASRGAVAAYAMTDTYLTPPATLADYFAQRPRTLRQDIKAFASEGLRLEVKSLAEALQLDRDLVLGTGRYGGESNPEVWRRDAELLAAHNDARTRAYCAFHGEDLVAVALFLVEGELASARVLRVAPERTRRGAVYFNVVFYGPIDHAPREGIRELHYGGGSIDMKYRRGCSLLPRWNVVVPLEPWSDERRALLRACGRSLLDGDRELLSRVMPLGELGLFTESAHQHDRHQ